MKKLNYIFIAAFTLLAMACSRDEKSLFPESAAQRMNDAVEKITNVLESSEKGWKVSFYPNHDNQMGGYVYTFRFKDGVAYIAAEIADDPTAEEASLYQVKGEQECLLTFDTYTEFLHLFSEPYASAVTGMESDYEFCFKSISEDENTLVFKGKRYGQPLILERFAEDEDPTEYMVKIAQMSETLSTMVPRSLAVVNQVDTLDVLLYDGLLTYSIQQVVVVDGEEVVDSEDYSYPYITTVDGIHFRDVVVLGNQSFQDCVYDVDEDVIKAVGADVYFPFALPEGYRTYEELAGNYTVSTDKGERPITVTCNADGATYTIKGMSYFNANSTIQASYNTIFGSFEIRPQYMALYANTYYLWIVVATPDDSVTWSTDYSVVGRNDEAGNVTFNGNKNGLMEWAFTTSTPSGSSSAGWVSDYGTPMKFTRVE